MSDEAATTSKSFLTPCNVVAGIILILLNFDLGFYILAFPSFWFIWANIMTTSTSLRFEKPKITISWFIVYPFGSIVGIAYFIWSLVYFNLIY